MAVQSAENGVVWGGWGALKVMGNASHYSIERIRLPVRL